jgi:hypothetical protein
MIGIYLNNSAGNGKTAKFYSVDTQDVVYKILQTAGWMKRATYSKNYNIVLITKIFPAVKNHLEGTEESSLGIIIIVKLSYVFGFCRW